MGPIRISAKRTWFVWFVPVSHVLVETLFHVLNWLPKLKLCLHVVLVVCYVTTDVRCWHQVGHSRSLHHRGKAGMMHMVHMTFFCWYSRYCVIHIIIVFGSTKPFPKGHSNCCYNHHPHAPSRESWCTFQHAKLLHRSALSSFVSGGLLFGGIKTFRACMWDKYGEGTTQSMCGIDLEVSPDKLCPESRWEHLIQRSTTRQRCNCY